MLDTEYGHYYRTGGLHPVHIDDIFHDRYRVVNKLGYGSFSTVWLVKDLRSGRWASLKILAADASKSLSEVSVTRHLQRSQDVDEGFYGKEFVIRVFDDFLIEGPNGNHQCIVAELLGPTLVLDFRDPLYFSIEVCKRLSAQVASGLAYLHRHGIIHGDLHLNNVLLQIPGADNWSELDVQTYYGEPILAVDSAPDEATPHRRPRYFVYPPDTRKLLTLCLGFNDDAHVKISDFGESFIWQGEAKAVKLSTPPIYAAPEIVFNGPIWPTTDIWALAVFIHMLFSRGEPIFHSYRNYQKEIIREMVLSLGKLPDIWWTKWEDRSKYFDETGLYIGPPDNNPPSRKLLNIFRMDQAEVEELERIFRKMLRYEPVDRISADEVVQLVSTQQGWPNFTCPIPMNDSTGTELAAVFS